jgi:hypothetical protein
MKRFVLILIVFVFILIGIGAIVVLTTDAYFFVFDVFRDSNITGDYSVDCIDTDGGLNGNIKGASFYGNFSYIDHCARGGESSHWSDGTAKEGDVIEYGCYDRTGREICGETYCRYKVINCSNGCKNGRCV